MKRALNSEVVSMIVDILNNEKDPTPDDRREDLIFQRKCIKAGRTIDGCVPWGFDKNRKKIIEWINHEHARKEFTAISESELYAWAKRLYEDAYNYKKDIHSLKDCSPDKGWEHGRALAHNRGGVIVPGLYLSRYQPTPRPEEVLDRSIRVYSLNHTTRPVWVRIVGGVFLQMRPLEMYRPFHSS